MGGGGGPADAGGHRTGLPYLKPLHRVPRVLHSCNSPERECAGAACHANTVRCAYRIVAPLIVWVARELVVLLHATQAALPAAADLELLPCHLCGLGLGGLSAAQLEGLEALHRAALGQVRLPAGCLVGRICSRYMLLMEMLMCRYMLKWTSHLCGDRGKVPSQRTTASAAAHPRMRCLLHSWLHCLQGYK